MMKKYRQVWSNSVSGEKWKKACMYGQAGKTEGISGEI